MAIELRDLKVGERGRVTGFENGDVSHRQKLLSMGLTSGTEFTVVRVAPLGDPVEIRVRDAFISLRRDEVSVLVVERLASDEDVEENKPLTIAIIGNPNAGKTTLFNGLTGTSQRVGNWPGVTVEKKVGLFRVADQHFNLVDLPGIYSLDAYNEACSIDERIARDYILSGEADLIINLVDTSHLEVSLYLTTQLLEMRVPVVAVLNIMEEDESHRAKFNLEAFERRLGCPVRSVIASRHRDVGDFKAELPQLARERPLPRFTIEYPPLIEKAILDLSCSIDDTPTPAGFDDRWLAVRLLERDAFAARQVDPAVREAREELASRIAGETHEEADVLIANSRYQFVHSLADEAVRKHASRGENISAWIDRIVLNRFLGIPIFLGVMYCLFWFTIKFARAFKPFVNQLSDIFFVEGSRQVLTALHTPGWLTNLLAYGLGNGFLQVVNFIPIIGFLYLFLAVLEESGYMARANFVMDRLMQALGLPGNAFVPMVVGFGCNVPSIMATRTLERPRDRIVAVLMSPFMSCGGRLAVYTIFAAAFFPNYGYLVIFGIYLLGIIFAMITAFFLKHSLLPEESSLYAMELPSYHWPKFRNVLISAWIRVKAFVFRVGKFIIPLVLLLQILSMWGTDGSFNKQPIERSMLAAGGQAITPVLAPIGIGRDQWPATVALLTGVMHKVVIVSTLDSIYMGARHKPLHDFNFVERIKQAASTVPQNLRALVGLGRPVPLHQFSSGLAPALSTRFDGTIGALAYLILLLCYPCIGVTSATTRETNQRWTAMMIFWTVSLGYGMAVLFYQVGTFSAHPLSSAAWIFGIVAYFGLIGAVATEFAPLSANAYPLRVRSTIGDEELAMDRVYRLVPSLKGVAGTFGGALIMVSLGAFLVAYGPSLLDPQQIQPSSGDEPQPALAQQLPASSSPKEASATIEKKVDVALTAKEEGSALESPTQTAGPVSEQHLVGEGNAEARPTDDQAAPQSNVQAPASAPTKALTIEEEGAAALTAVPADATAENQQGTESPAEELGLTIEPQSETNSQLSADTEPTRDPGGEAINENVLNEKGVEIAGASAQAKLLALLEGKVEAQSAITWFDFDNLVFSTGQATLTPESREEVEQIARILSAYPNTRAIIAGHTDNTGAARTNQRISKARAESVLRELTQMGVDASRLEARGYAGDRPIASNDTEEGRAKNRRISVGVIRE